MVGVGGGGSGIDIASPLSVHPLPTYEKWFLGELRKFLKC